MRRPRFARWTALHVTVKVTRAVKSLRRRSAYHAVRKALQVVMRRADMRIVHLSLERDHIHLLIEAASTEGLARGMQAFQISAAQLLNQAVSKDTGERRRGQVFVDRYFERVLKNPTQAYRALNYVLNNWRKHREDRGPRTRHWDFDFFSSAPSFAGWKEHEDDPPGQPPVVPPTYERLFVWQPQTWLLAEGWRRVGSISLRAVPGHT